MVLAVGYAGLLAKAVVVKRTIAFVTLIVTLPISVKAVVWGIVFSNFMEMIVSFYCVRKALGYSIRNQFTIMADIALAATLSAASAWFATLIFHGDFFKLCMGIFTGLSVYVVVLYMLKVEERKYFDQIMAKLTNRSN